MQQFLSRVKKLAPLICAWVIILVAIFGAYSNHFENTFHLDDSHAIVENPHIRSLANWTRFFTDRSTFSSLPTHQGFRPLVTLSLAVDYYLGEGLEPFFFHLSTFVWFLVQIVVMGLLFRTILLRSGATLREANWASLTAAAAYGLHPVIADTVNYMVQRAEVFATLGILLSLLLYAGFPRARRFGLYLIPLFVAGTAKETAIMGVGFLGLYIWLFEQQQTLTTFPPPALRQLILRCLPAAVLCFILLALHGHVPFLSASGGGATHLSNPLLPYMYAQMFVIAYFVRSVFLPLDLAMESDWEVIPEFYDTRVFAGVFLIVMMLVWAVRASRGPRGKPIAFGVLWFFASLLPVIVTPLAEVRNNHRMFLPYVGLMLSVVWQGWLLLKGLLDRYAALAFLLRTSAVAVVVALLTLAGYATFQRNKVWLSDESMWWDVAQKSPRHARGLMHYGLSQMARGRYQVALDYFQRAHQYAPNYSVLEVNLGVVKNALKSFPEAEQHFKRAISLAPGLPSSYSFYARFLIEHGRFDEAASLLLKALAISRTDLSSRSLLMEVYSKQGAYDKLKQLAEETLQIAPDYEPALNFLRAETSGEGSAIEQATAALMARPSPENFVQLSMLYYQQGDFERALELAESALLLRADYPEAHNNKAAALNSLKRFKEGAAAAREALRLRPDFERARGNLKYAEQQLANPSR